MCMQMRSRSEAVPLEAEGTRPRDDQPENEHDEEEDQELKLVLLARKWLRPATRGQVRGDGQCGASERRRPEGNSRRDALLAARSAVTIQHRARRCNAQTWKISSLSSLRRHRKHLSRSVVVVL